MPVKYLYTRVLTLIPRIPTLISCVPTLIPSVPTLIPCVLTMIHCVPTLIPRIPTLIPCVPIISLIPFHDSPFRLLQIAYLFKERIQILPVRWPVDIETYLQIIIVNSEHIHLHILFLLC